MVQGNSGLVTLIRYLYIVQCADLWVFAGFSTTLAQFYPGFSLYCWSDRETWAVSWETCLKVFVLVVPKEGLAGGAIPAFGMTQTTTGMKISLIHETSVKMKHPKLHWYDKDKVFPWHSSLVLHCCMLNMHWVLLKHETDKFDHI